MLFCDGELLGNVWSGLWNGNHLSSWIQSITSTGKEIKCCKTKIRNGIMEIVSWHSILER